MHSQSIETDMLNRDTNFDTKQIAQAATGGNQGLPEQGWGIEGCVPGQDSIAKIPLRNWRVSIGRDPHGDICLPSPNVSKQHAQIILSENQIHVADLGSTNGTFVNGQRIAATAILKEGDLVQFADVELRLVKIQTTVVDRTAVEARPEHRWALSSMHKVISGNEMATFFQPIVTADKHELIGYEALVRATVDGLESPLVLFDQAVKLGVEQKLSDVCRVKALETIDQAGAAGTLFLNTHPNESLEAELLNSIQKLRDASPDRKIVIEIHESAVTRIDLLREFATALHDLDIQLAFDDFGAGQSRLVEICQVSPDILKFDRSLIRSIVQGERNYKLVATLHESAKQMDICTLAEGVETPEEIAACIEIGFDLFQGYAFGKPNKISEFI
ncbi:EAL domain-containing protein [bacterium]|nr:EAL domain-containing protein [bacterium]